MEEVAITKSVNDKNKSVTYTKRLEKGGVTYMKEVKKVEGGYIIRESKYGKPEGSEEYIDESKEYVTTTNPFDKEEKKESDDDKMFSFIDEPTMF